MMRRPQPTPPPPKVVEFDPTQGIVVSEEPLITKGPVEMKIPATTFIWELRPKDLENALRPYLHQTLKHLPAKHFVKVEPINHLGSFLGLKFVVVVPEVA